MTCYSSVMVTLRLLLGLPLGSDEGDGRVEGSFYF